MSVRVKQTLRLHLGEKRFGQGTNLRTTSVETEKNIKYKHKCKNSGVVEALKAVCGQ